MPQVFSRVLLSAQTDVLLSTSTTGYWVAAPQIT